MYEENIRPEDKIDIFEKINSVLSTLKKHFLWFFLLILLISGVWVARSFFLVKPIYQATTTFFIKVDTTANYRSKAAMGNPTETLEAAFPALLKSDRMRQILRQEEKLDMSGVQISVNVIPTTSLFTLTANSSSSKRSLAVINGILNNYSKIAEYTVGDITLELVQEPEAIPAPINVSPLPITIAKGALGGALAAVLIALLLSWSRSTLTSSTQLKELVNLPYLGTVWKQKVKKRRESGLRHPILDRNTGEAFREAFRVLRSKIRKNLSNDAVSYVVTSPVAGEGKTVIAINLAIDTADSGKKVLLIDGNFHRPSVRKYLGLKSKNVTSLIQSEVQDKTLEFTKFEQVRENLDVITFSEETNQAYKYFQAGNGAEFMAQQKATYDIVIIDSAPCTVSQDVFLFGRETDGVLLIARYDFTTKRQLFKAVELLNSWNLNILGTVLNENENTGTSPYYSYYSHYYGKHSY